MQFYGYRKRFLWLRSELMPWRDKLVAQHNQRKLDSLWRDRQVVESPQGPRVIVAGKEYLNFCSNDYLGLANHPELAEAAAQAARHRGTGSGASHLVCGHSKEHQELESELADFVCAEKAIVFSTGYMANLAIPQAFLGREDLVLQDRLNHASLIDAGRFCEAKMKRYPHLDLVAVEKELANSKSNRKLVVTDGVFSMDGDTAPVAELKRLCAQHSALLFVDDAHGFGVMGAKGFGTLEQAKVAVSKNVLMLGTLGKSAGSFGAFVAGDSVYIESLVQFARTYIYTTALPPTVIAASRSALQIIAQEPERREKLKQNIAQFRDGLADAEYMESSGLKLLESHTPIQPLVLGSSESAIAASEFLKENGVWVSAIRPPTVPAGSARLRITLTAGHEPEDIALLVSLLKKFRVTV